MKTRGTSAHGGQTQRQLRVGELARHALADIFQRENLFDPALKGVFITVPQVRMSPDLRHATCFVMPLGGKSIDKVVAALERNKKFLRVEIAKRLELRVVPELHFHPDESFAEGDKIDAILRSPEVLQDLQPHKSAVEDEDAQ